MTVLTPFQVCCWASHHHFSRAFAQNTTRTLGPLFSLTSDVALAADGTLSAFVVNTTARFYLARWEIPVTAAAVAALGSAHVAPALVALDARAGF